MKKIIITAVIIALSQSMMAQQVNWRSLKSNQQHIINVNIGLDYGATLGIEYGRKLPIKFPVIATIGYSSPAGEEMFDDFKTRLGAQAEVLKIGNFSTTVKAHSIFRRYQNESVRMINFGSEFLAVAGYYKAKWYVAGEFGFDKAITTQVKHSKWMHENNPNIQDAWYLPTGGNFIYGIQSGFSFASNDLTLKLGKVVNQDLNSKPMIPFYVQFGFNKRF